MVLPGTISEIKNQHKQQALDEKDQKVSFNIISKPYKISSHSYGRQSVFQMINIEHSV